MIWRAFGCASASALARQDRVAGSSWLGRLLPALRRAAQRREARGPAATKVLERDGALSCPEPGLVHRPWRDPAG
jgi:hypothetical protein